jgi:hypothetical protein
VAVTTDKLQLIQEEYSLLGIRTVFCCLQTAIIYKQCSPSNLNEQDLQLVSRCSKMFSAGFKITAQFYVEFKVLVVNNWLPHCHQKILTNITGSN